MKNKGPGPDDPLGWGIDRLRDRRARWARDGERPLALNLAMIGVLGWLVVVPSLLGVLAGRWVDRRVGGGISFTAMFLVLGVALGARLAWRRAAPPKGP